MNGASTAFELRQQARCPEQLQCVTHDRCQHRAFHGVASDALKAMRVYDELSSRRQAMNPKQHVFNFKFSCYG